MIQKRLLFTGIFSAALLVILLFGCRKIDLKRIAAVNTVEVSGITSSQATVHGEIIDMGEEEVVQDIGFCWSTSILPTIADQRIFLGSATSKGPYSYIISGLQNNTNYSVRAFVDDGDEIFYGNAVQFKTDFGMTTGEWLHYDDGQNADGIGLVEGGSFDYAIRFPASDLTAYNGFTISKIRFFPKTGSPVEYHMTLWEGSGTPSLLYDEQIPNFSVNAWTEYTPTFSYVIDGFTELWVGIWVVNAPAGYYPAGCDNGPAVAGYGDMFSTDDGATWDALSILNPDLNYNWNLQVYVTDSKGKSTVLTNKSLSRKRYGSPGKQTTKPASLTNAGRHNAQY